MYAKKQGYAYLFFFRTREQWQSESGGLSPGWGKVFFLQKLLNESYSADYFMYLDIDTIFVRDDVRLDDIIGKVHQNTSLFAQDIAPNTRLAQSHAFILKNSAFTNIFIQRWWELRTSCPDVAMEQGAYYQAIGEAFENYFRSSVTQLECIKFCSETSPIRQHSCFDNWMKSNGFGPGVNKHPFIHTFPYVEEHWGPSDGFTTQLRHRDKSTSGLAIVGNPFTVHPCKHPRHVYHDPAILPRTCR